MSACHGASPPRSEVIQAPFTTPSLPLPWLLSVAEPCPVSRPVPFEASSPSSLSAVKPVCSLHPASLSSTGPLDVLAEHYTSIQSSLFHPRSWLDGSIHIHSTAPLAQPHPGVAWVFIRALPITTSSSCRTREYHRSPSLHSLFSLIRHALPFCSTRTDACLCATLFQSVTTPSSSERTRRRTPAIPSRHCSVTIAHAECSSTGVA